MTLATNPFEVGLDRLVDVEKSQPFIGKNVLRRVKSQGVQRRLAGVEIDGAKLDLNMTPWPVRRGSEVIGQITSAVHSPRLKKNIGYAMVPVGDSTPGAKLTVDTPDGERGATVVPMPFIDPAKTIAKS